MDNFTTDYVYSVPETDEIKNVNIKINVQENNFLITMSSDYILTDCDILSLLKQFNNNFLKNHRISIVDECDIFVNDKDSSRKIELESGDFFIKKIIKQN